MEPDGITRVYSSHHNPIQATTRYPNQAYHRPQFIGSQAQAIIERADFRCVAISRRVTEATSGTPAVYEKKYSCYEGASGYDIHFNVDSTDWGGDNLFRLVQHLEQRTGKTGLTILAS